MKKEFIDVMLAAVIATGLAGCGDSGGTGTGATAAGTQATEAQKERVKNDAKREDEKEDSEASDSEGASDSHIGIITGSVSQSEDDRRGTETFQTMYGEDMVKLVIYPSNFTEKLETTVQTTVDLSDDPKMKAIIMSQSVPGTTEVFRKVKETRPGILYIIGEGHKDLPETGSAAGLVYNNDFVARGYLTIRTAHGPGCDTFVHISFPRHMAYETMSRRVVVMREACKGFDMEFVLETAPNPTPDVGVAGAQTYILEKVPEWAEKYGENAACLCTSDTHAEPLLERLMEYGSYFIETDLSSPLMDYPGAPGIDLTAKAGNFDKIPAKVKSTVVERDGAGHFGTWAYSHGYTTSASLAQRALNVLDDGSELDDIDDIAEVYQVLPPRVEWSDSNYTNAETGVGLNNVFLVYQDAYIMGDPGHSVGSTEIEVPEGYFTIR